VHSGANTELAGQPEARRLNVFNAANPCAIREQSPFHRPDKIGNKTGAAIIELHLKHPAIGARKLKRILENYGKNMCLGTLQSTPYCIATG